jgi:uncharacterized protein YdeI (BOF family)
MATEPESLRERLDRATVLKVALAAFVVLALGWIGYAVIQSMTHPAAEEGSIAAIRENPDQYLGERVSLNGEIVETTENGYVFSDGTGKITVITNTRPDNPESVGMVTDDVERRNDEIVLVEQTRM